LESNLTFAEYKNHIKFMERNDNSNSSVHWTSNGNRSGGSMESPTLNARDTNNTKPICRLSDTDIVK